MLPGCGNFHKSKRILFKGDIIARRFHFGVRARLGSSVGRLARKTIQSARCSPDTSRNSISASDIMFSNLALCSQSGIMFSDLALRSRM